MFSAWQLSTHLYPWWQVLIGTFYAALLGSALGRSLIIGFFARSSVRSAVYQIVGSAVLTVGTMAMAAAFGIHACSFLIATVTVIAFAMGIILGGQGKAE
jgi:uncharacterized membrane protein YbhN (UPF0104 family)